MEEKEKNIDESKKELDADSTLSNNIMQNKKEDKKDSEEKPVETNGESKKLEDSKDIADNDKKKNNESKESKNSEGSNGKSDIKSEDSEKKKIVDRKDEKKFKKNEAIVSGKDLRMSTKHSMAICKIIKGKEIDGAISTLNDIQKFERPIPMKGEIPHKKGMMSGRFPKKAVGEFIRLLKSLKANAIVNDLELEKGKIICNANVASRPYRRFGRARFKRTNLNLKLVAR